jgi:nucleotide-binding universal stress UspA family protein
MAPFRRILVPVDFSTCSDVALDRALSLARAVGGQVEVLHVWASPEFVPVDASLTIATPGGEKINLTEYLRRQAQHSLAELVANVQARGFEGVTSRLVMGDPSDVIVAASKQYDLIVMGTHGRRAVAHLFLGSVAERVVRRAECPVLTVRVESEKSR